jgi:hypothetical protein
MIGMIDIVTAVCFLLRILFEGDDKKVKNIIRDN